MAAACFFPRGVRGASGTDVCVSGTFSTWVAFVEICKILLTCVVEVDIVLCLSVASENDAGVRCHVCGGVVLR